MDSDENGSAQQLKIVLYISKLLYTKYEPIWFIIYMYIIYFRIAKRKLKYNIRMVPDDVIINCTSKHNIFNDINNTVIVNEKNLYKFDKLLKLVCESSNNFRFVYVIGSKHCAENEILVNSVHCDNLKNNGILSKVQLQNYNEKLVHFAEEINVSLVATPIDVSNSLCETILGKYFKTPKLVAPGDIIDINIKYFAEDLYFINSKVSFAENIYFKSNKVLSRNMNDNCFCAVGETSIRQSANVQSFLPKKHCRLTCSKVCGPFKEIPLCPYGLQEYLDDIQAAIRPFLGRRKLNLKPVFLIQGETGNGEEILLHSVAHYFGLHFYKVNNSDLMANVYAQNETKLRNIFFNGKMAAPCLITIFNFESFGKNNDGQYDERLMGNFADELEMLFDDIKFPVILFCCSTSTNIPTNLKKLFLQSFVIDHLTTEQREKNLEWIIDEKGLETDCNLSDVANKTHSFHFEDLQALVYYARINNENLSQDKIVLDETSFTLAIDYMQANYNESLGAPKVPKVQWSDIGGLTDVKEEIIKTINLPLKYPEFLRKSGLRRSGILLFGPPGTGKTLIAKAVATECNLCFLSVKGPELLNMYVGQSEQNIREVFQRARQASPCIIFFDELDSLAPNRGLSGDSGGVMDRVVSQLLAEMDGLNETATIFIIGATNRPDLIDPALLRPGRFDKLLYVGACTDQESKLSVLKALTRKFILNEELNLEDVINICPKNLTGADFYGICSNAWTSAVRKLIKKISAGLVADKDVTHADVVVDFDDFKTAIQSTKPSINAEDLIYFEKLKAELSSIT